MVEKFVILADSTCDLEPALREKYDIRYVPGHLICPDGKELPVKLDWSEYADAGFGSASEFYARLAEKPDGFKTSPPNTAELLPIFADYAAQGIGVMMITISSGMSVAYSSAFEARRIILEQYPSANIRCVDSLRFSVCSGLMAINASLMRDAGLSLDEAADKLLAERLMYHQAGWHDNLAFAARKGRITNSKAFFGKLIGIRPIGECSDIGLTTVIAKAKGETRAFDACFEYLKRTITNPEKQVILVAHSDRKDKAEAYCKRIREELHPVDVVPCGIYPSCGVNIGPGIVSAYYVGKPISKDLEQEKAIFNDILK